ncbi:unnamed protein product [Lathyrus sativus]|nr:unnamed protein product [Lathyrus sativus]
MSRLYVKLHDCGQLVEWKNLVYGNNARPRANFILWLACHGRLATKDKLLKYGMIDNNECWFYAKEETLNHLFFECESLKNVWKEILRWAQINHTPGSWHSKVKWLIQQTKGKGVRAAVIKMEISETIYEIWKARNNKNFGETNEITTIGRNVIDTLVYRGWNTKKLIKYIAILMIEGG